MVQEKSYWSLLLYWGGKVERSHVHRQLPVHQPFLGMVQLTSERVISIYWITWSCLDNICICTINNLNRLQSPKQYCTCKDNELLFEQKMRLIKQHHCWEFHDKIIYWQELSLGENSYSSLNLWVAMGFSDRKSWGEITFSSFLSLHQIAIPKADLKLAYLPYPFLL